MKSPHRNKKGERKVKRVVLGVGYPISCHKNVLAFFKNHRVSGSKVYMSGEINLRTIAEGKKIRLIAEIIP